MRSQVRFLSGVPVTRRDGHCPSNFILNLTTTPLGVVELLFLLCGASPCTNSAIIRGSGFFISAHRRNMQGELYVRRDGRFTPNFLLNLTTTPLDVVGRYFYFAGSCTCTKSAIIYGSGFFYLHTSLRHFVTRFRSSSPPNGKPNSAAELPHSGGCFLLLSKYLLFTTAR